jgi:DNA-binding LacI/PurR family transcriptional regulator
MAKGPTVYDVASKAGVSIATVSFTFRQPSRVRESTREAVIAAARDLGYVPSGSARGLARGRTGVLGLFSFDFLWDAPDRRDPLGPSAVSSDELVGEPHDDFRLFPVYLDEVQRGFEVQCWRQGYDLMIGGRRSDPGEGFIADIAGRVDGLAVFPQTLPKSILLHIARRIPVVELGSEASDDGLSHLTVDNAQGMRLMADHLIDHHGMRDFVLVGSMVNADSEPRKQAFAEILRERRLPVRPALQHPFGAKSGAAAVLSSMREDGQLPQAFVCVSDDVALTVMDALRELGVSVPGDVVVTGFDGLAAGAVARPALTTIRQPMSDIGRLAADALIARAKDPAATPQSLTLPVRMLVRESCGCTRA